MFQNKVLFISGGTGSYGSAFCKYIIKTGDIPKKLVIYSRDWLKQQNLCDELGNPEFMRWRLGDIRDYKGFKRASADSDIVIHAAALKNLPTAEQQPDETMTINIDGTRIVRDCCIENGIEKAILISTDKACMPINTYGISKAAAERAFIDGNVYSAGRTKFSVCRYGNVIGSSGSIIPVWNKLIANGETVLPITDEQMTRYFFKMEDAIRFVIDCFGKMKGGELFIPRLPSVRIVDLAEVYGLPYKLIGIRQGEKIHETMDGIKNSGENDWFLSVNEIKESIKEFI